MSEINQQSVLAQPSDGSGELDARQAQQSFFTGASNITIDRSYFTAVNNFYGHPNAAPASTTTTQNYDTVPNWQDIYKEYSQKLSMGYLLWDPSPDSNTTARYQSEGIKIGDIGVISDLGKFGYGFNVQLPADHEDNINRTPPGFQPFGAMTNQTTTREFNTGHLTHQSSMPLDATENHAVDFGRRYRDLLLTGHSISAEGVIVVAPSGFMVTDTEPFIKGMLSRWINGHSYSWYKHMALRLGHLSNGDLHIVIGSVKTDLWGMAALTHASDASSYRGRNFHFNFRAYQDMDGFGPQCIWQSCGGNIWHNTRIRPVENDTPVQCNQSLFIRTLTITLGNDQFQKLQDELKVVNANRSGRSDSGLKPENAKFKAMLAQNYKRRMVGRRSAGKRATGDENAWSPTPASPSAHDAVFYSDDEYDSGTEENPSSSSEVHNDSDKAHEPQPVQTEFRSNVTDHPSSLLNKELLKLHPQANVAITSDDNWMKVVEMDMSKAPYSSEELVARVLASHDVIFKDGMVSVSFRSEATSPAIPANEQKSIPIADQHKQESLPIPLPKGKPKRAGISTISTKSLGVPTRQKPLKGRSPVRS